MDRQQRRQLLAYVGISMLATFLAVMGSSTPVAPLVPVAAQPGLALIPSPADAQNSMLPTVAGQVRLDDLTAGATDVAVKALGHQLRLAAATAPAGHIVLTSATTARVRHHRSQTPAPPSGTASGAAAPATHRAPPGHLGTPGTPSQPPATQPPATPPATTQSPSATRGHSGKPKKAKPNSGHTNFSANRSLRVTRASSSQPSTAASSHGRSAPGQSSQGKSAQGKSRQAPGHLKHWR